jgi:hypothetical protein
MLVNNVSFSGGFRILPPPPATNIPVQSGLVMQLDATNNLSYPGTGTVVTDITGGFNHNLTLAAMYKNLGGIKYFEFDPAGTTRKMLVSGTGPVLNTGGYTYMMWAYAPSSATSRWLVGATDNQPALFVNNSDSFTYRDNSGNGRSLGGTPAANVWRQITLTCSSADVLTLYINGSGAGGSGSGGNCRGRNHVGFGQNLNWGNVSICCLYNRVLSLSEVQTNFNGLKSYFGVA